MADETMRQIVHMTNERLALYRQHLTPEQHDRLNTLNAQIPLFWDRYRREYASERWGSARERKQEMWQAA